MNVPEQARFGFSACDGKLLLFTFETQTKFKLIYAIYLLICDDAICLSWSCLPGLQWVSHTESNLKLSLLCRGFKRSLEASSAALQRTLRQKSTDVRFPKRFSTIFRYLSSLNSKSAKSLPRVAYVCRLTSQLSSWTKAQRSSARVLQARMVPSTVNRWGLL